MQSPSVVSNGTKVRDDETAVLAGSREVALCLPIDLGAAFRFRLRNALLGKWVEGVVGMARNHLDVKSANRKLSRKDFIVAQM